MNTTGIGIQWRQYSPLGTWTNIAYPTWPYTLNIVNPAWVFVRLYGVSNSAIISGPWVDMFANGSLPDSDVFTGDPVSGTPTTSVTVNFGSWHNSLSTAEKSHYTIQTANAVAGASTPTSFQNTATQTIQATGSRDIWARLVVENRYRISSFGGAFVTANSNAIKIGTYSRT